MMRAARTRPPEDLGRESVSWLARVARRGAASPHRNGERPDAGCGEGEGT